MTYSVVSSSVNATASVATFNIKTALPKNQTSAQAVNIGNLTEQSTVINVSDQGSVAGNAVSTTFSTQAGDLTTLAQTFGNIVNQVDTHYQLFDSTGTLLADNMGSTAQQALFEQLISSGANLPADTYTATATPQANSTAAISSYQTQGTALQVNSQLTGSDSSEYYNFALTTGNNIKLALDAGNNNPSVRVQLYNSNGNLVADSEGNPFQKANYIALSSGTGLTSSAGNYQVKVSYANGVDPNTNSINYNLQLYSGSTYSILYKNTVAAKPTDTTAVGSVTPTSNALLYSRNAYNTIAAKPSSAINIGWVQQNVSALDVVSQLTSADSTDYYSLTLQTGDNLKFGFVTGGTPSPADLRVQILDGTGSEVLADSGGTAAQQAAYKKLTTTDGLAAKPGTYMVKVSYAANVTNKTTNNYEFQVLSGTAYNAQYKTYASAQTYGNALLTGGVAGLAASTGMANYLTALSNGTTSDIMSAISTKV